MSGCGVIVVGGSWGGLQAVSRVLSELPADLPAPVVVVLHRGESSPNLLAGALARASRLEVSEADDKAALAPGHVYVAPPGYHLLVERGHLALSTDDAVGFSRPSIDVTLETAADAYGPAAVGVVLTGANDDGSAGLAEVRRRGGVAIVQDPATAEHPAMPAAAIAAADPHAVVSLEDIAPLLVGLARAPAGTAHEVLR